MLGDNGNEGIIGRSVQKLFQEKHEMESLGMPGQFNVAGVCDQPEQSTVSIHLHENIKLHERNEVICFFPA